MKNILIFKFLSSPRPIKRFISIGYDILAISASFYLAYVLRLGTLDININSALLTCLGLTLLVSIATFVRMGLYRAILRYMSQQAMVTIFAGILISSLAMTLSAFFTHAFLPRSVPIIYIFTTLILIGLPRLVFRNVVKMVTPRGNTKVIIYGAGETGNNLAAQLQLGSEFNPVAFVDDNKRLQGNVLSGLRVYSPYRLAALIEQHGATRILLALGNISRQERVRIIRYLEPLLVQVQTIPPVTDIVKGVARINELRNIQIEDLLGRDPVEPDALLMSKNTSGKVVMVTGAGGSIGSELCRQLIKLNPHKIVLFEQNEFNLYRIEKDLNAIQAANNSSVELVPLLGSVQNFQLLDMVMRQFEVHCVYHAAAYKHVPMVEQNIIEGVKNNLFGTKNAAEAALRNNVKNFVLISTDKAVRPTNVMGASKRLAEMVLQDLATRTSKTIFSMVRFGNVLDSSGSVVPRFREQINKGGPITVTHKDIVRYFMTISEAAQLVIQSASIAQGGDVFVLDMGEPVKIMDLAREMALLSGYSIRDEHNPNGDIEIKITGLRAGEKLYEELLCGENCEGTVHPRIMRAQEKKMASAELETLLTQAKTFCDSYRYQELFSLIVDSEADFQPLYEISDHMKKIRRENAKLLLISNVADKIEQR
ncbi:nucleoside-diphosphate sugar epimerase/dehydratase [Cellvibrio sp. NN19]|uniref:polysaccharide biosynthesis protein n=1 Tax=Cellvibrio chitinivorans TaxID=3102792 RepID=UPI002B40C98F|nr:nucleoside-diphosphate sugar epimerase/dehydratase [Cellvibrio sp. NN19]